MNLMANARIRIRQNAVTRVKRTATGKGQITVAVGQEVSPDDSLGKFKLQSGFRMIDVAVQLSVSPKEAKGLLQRKIGQKIFRGELLAFKKGSLFSGDKVITSPSDATLNFFDDKTGELRLELDAKEVSLLAGVYGIIEKVDPLRGDVVIKTQATEICGILGTGKVREGVLKVLGGPGLLVDQKMIPDNLSGDIVVAGGLVYGDAIFKAMRIGMHGLITGGINASDYRSITGSIYKKNLQTDIGLSLMVTEGFGVVPIGNDVFEAATEHDGKFAILDGGAAKLILPSFDGTSIINLRKVALPKLGLEELKPELQAQQLEIGQKVRVIGTEYLGQQGKIVSINSQVDALPSKIRTYMVTVEAKNGKFKIPYTNLEIIV